MMSSIHQRTPRRYAALLSSMVVMSLLVSACAGSVGKYRDAAVTVTDGVAAPVRDQQFAAPTAAPSPHAERPQPTDAGPGASGDATAPSNGGAAPPPAHAPPNEQDPSGGEPEGPTEGTNGSGDPAAPPPDDPQPASPEVGVTPNQVTLGLFYPKTGAYATYGRNAERVVQAAFNEVNERGGVHGRQLAVKSYDDGTGDAATIRANERRARDETFAFLSLVGDTNEILAGLAEQDQIPFVVGNISERQASQLRYSFTTLTYWTTQARILVGFIQNHLQATDRRIAVVYETSQSMQDTKDIFKAAAGRQGLEVVFEQPIDRNQATCANQVNNLQSRNVGLVFIMAGPIGASCLLRDSEALGYDPIWTGVGATFNLDITAAAAGGAADGIETLGVATTLETPAGRHYAETMEKYYPDSGAETEDAMLLIYSMTRFYIEALERTGPNLTREAFVSAIENRMTGWETPYLPPPRFAPGQRPGPNAVSVTRCCVDNRWITPNPGWRTAF